MKRLVFLLSLAAVLFGCSDSDETTVLRVALPPGRIADFERVVVPGFEVLTGVTIESIGMRSADQVARLRIEREHPSVDVLWIDYGEAQLLAQEGLLAELTEEDIPNLAHVRDDAVAVDGLDLVIEDGKLTTLLGPSGSGKTTVLRLVAGFVTPDEGSIVLDGSDIAKLPPEKRDVGMVFQKLRVVPAPKRLQERRLWFRTTQAGHRRDTLARHPRVVAGASR